MEIKGCFYNFIEDDEDDNYTEEELSNIVSHQLVNVIVRELKEDKINGCNFS